MKVKLFEPEPEHVAFHEAMKARIKEHAANMDAMVILALVSKLVGQLVAVQDQRRYTADQVMEIVGMNIEEGNADVVRGLLSSAGPMQ